MKIVLLATRLLRAVRRVGSSRRGGRPSWRPLRAVAKLEHDRARPLTDDGDVLVFRSRHGTVMTTEVVGCPDLDGADVEITGDEVPSGWVELRVDGVLLTTVRGCNRAPDGVDIAVLPARS